MTVDVKSWNNQRLDPGKLPRPWEIDETTDNLMGTCHVCVWVRDRDCWRLKFVDHHCDRHGRI